jgi:hypothetical protein
MDHTGWHYCSGSCRLRGFCEACSFSPGGITTCDDAWCRTRDSFCDEYVATNLKTRAEWLIALPARTGYRAVAPEVIERLRSYAEDEAAELEDDSETEQRICSFCACKERKTEWNGQPVDDEPQEVYRRQRRAPSPDEPISPVSLVRPPTIAEEMAIARVLQTRGA